VVWFFECLFNIFRQNSRRAGLACPYKFSTYTKKVNLEQILQHYHRLNISSTLYQKAGLRLLPNAVKKLFSNLDVQPSQHVVDATGGTFALSQRTGMMVESSRTTLRCLQKSLEGLPNVTLLAGAIWDAPKGQAEIVFLTPQTDKGNLRVEADLMGACTCLEANGVAYFVMHKDQGAKRYEKLAQELFGELEVLDKEEGWRLCKAVKRTEETFEVKRLEFSVLDLNFQAEPGVYAAGKLDPGTAFLLGAFEITSVVNKRVLDIGCGYGLLSLKAALAGAEVTALDDDLLAVRSTHHNAQHYGLDIRTLHSDVNSELHDDERFDVVLTNPPFHSGKQVMLEVPQAFIAAAYKHLVPGGELVLVANKALAYETLLEEFSYWELLATNQQFKVLRAIR
jgi:16S rRNA (guanine1207-N2)-methyltransferase